MATTGNSTEFSALLRTATAKQAPQIRQAVADLAIMCLSTRPVDMKAFKAAISFVLKHTRANLTQNPGLAGSPEAYFDAVAQGLDDAMVVGLRAIQTAAQHFLDIGVKPDMPAIAGITKTLERFPAAFTMGLESAQGSFGEEHSAAWRGACQRLMTKSSATQTATKGAQSLRESTGKTPEFSQFMLKGVQDIRANIGVYVAGVLMGAMRKG